MCILRRPYNEHVIHFFLDIFMLNSILMLVNFCIEYWSLVLSVGSCFYSFLQKVLAFTKGGVMTHGGSTGHLKRIILFQDASGEFQHFPGGGVQLFPITYSYRNIFPEGGLVSLLDLPPSGLAPC